MPEPSHAAARLYPAALPVPETVEGGPVLVRPFDVPDAPALTDAVAESRDHLRPWMPWADTHQSIEESVEFCARARAQWLTRQNMNLGVFERSTGRCLGGTGLHNIDWDVRRFEIGYWLRASAEGHGYMGAAVRLVARLAFEHLGANRVEIRCDSLNVRSRRVAERAGFVLEGTLRRTARRGDGTLRDTLVFALVREEFEALAPTWQRELEAAVASRPPR